jgi:hypothetical protein
MNSNFEILYLKIISEKIMSIASQSVAPTVQKVTSDGRPVKLCICTPLYGGLGYATYFISLINTMNLLAKNGIECEPIFILGESLITRARNNIVAKFLNKPEATHLMFIDGDISWNPVEVLKLLKHDKDLCGGIYPMKTYKWEGLNDLEKFKERHQSDLHKNVPFPEFVRQNLMKYNLNYKSASFGVQNNLVEVKHIATGFMMIKRATLEKMILALPELKFWDDMGCLNKDEDRFAYTLFDCQTVEGHYFSEDWLFCHRWEKLGGEIYVDVTINLTHTGTHQFPGRFISSLNIMSKAPDQSQEAPATQNMNEAQRKLIEQAEKLASAQSSDQRKTFPDKPGQTRTAVTSPAITSPKQEDENVRVQEITETVQKVELEEPKLL